MSTTTEGAVYVTLAGAHVLRVSIKRGWLHLQRGHRDGEGFVPSLADSPFSIPAARLGELVAALEELA